MSTPSQTKNKLHDLLDVAVDGQNGFQRASEMCATEAPTSIRSYFMSAAEACKVAASDLRRALQKRGELPDDDGTLGAKMHRGWMTTRRAFAIDEADAVLAEVIRGEEHALSKYDEAISEVEDSDLRLMLARHRAGVVENMDRAKELRKRREALGS